MSASLTEMLIFYVSCVFLEIINQIEYLGVLLDRKLKLNIILI